MTEISITPEINYDRTIEMVHTGEDTRLSITTVVGSEGIDSFLGYEEAHRLADWIKENVPVPKSPAEIAFDAIEIGQHFGFYADGENPTRFPYTKVSETTYEARYPEPWHEGTKTLNPESTYLPFAEPKPTLREQFEALPVGTVFTWGSKVLNVVKVSEDRIFDAGDVETITDYDWDRPGDLEVIPVD